LPLTVLQRAEAFEDAAADWEQLDKMQASAENRRSSTFLLLDYYRRAQVQDALDAAGDIIDVTESPTIASEQSECQEPGSKE